MTYSRSDLEDYGVHVPALSRCDYSRTGCLVVIACIEIALMQKRKAKRTTAFLHEALKAERGNLPIQDRIEAGLREMGAT